MKTNLIDIFSSNYEFLGTASKAVAHKTGLWHRVFTCLIVNSEKKTVFLQKKYPNRYEFDRPDYLDVSVGGHYEAGETIESGIRELMEETNIKNVSINDLISLGVRQTSFCISPNYIANEFQHIYLYDFNKDVNELLSNNNEVSSFVEIDILGCIDIILQRIRKINAKQCYIDRNKKNVRDIEIKYEDFIPSYLKGDQFMLRLLIAAKRYCFLEYDEGLLFW